jgi:serine/threonine protein kinase
MSQVYETRIRQSLTLDQRIAGGGEGDIWSVAGQPEVVAKIYHAQAAIPVREAKLRAMIASPPRDDMIPRYGHVSIAWPYDLLYQGNALRGFLMPRLAQSFTIFDIYNPALRKKACPGFNWKYLFHTGVNLSRALEALHARDYVMGDINEGNILVTARALVSLIDTDSYQVRDGSGNVYRCPVGKAEFTPPELQGVPFDQVDRQPEHDYFGLGVLIFLLLMEGNHPFAGVLKRDIQTGEPSNIYCLRQGRFPHLNNPLVGPRPVAPKFDILPPAVQRLMVRCFVDGHRDPKARPSAAEWARALEKAEASLVVCKKDPEHYYARHLRSCPWCKPEPAPQAPTPVPPTPKPILQTPLPAARPPSRSRAARPAPRLHLPALPFKRPRLPGLAAGRYRFHTAWEGLKGLFRSPGRRLTRQIWWQEARFYILGGAAGGVSLFGLVLLMFRYPLWTGYAIGVLTGTLIAAPAFAIAWFSFRGQERSGRVIGLAAVLLGGYLAITQGLRFSALSAAYLGVHHVQAGWLLAASLGIGVFEGTAWGNWRSLVGRRSPALAGLSSLAIAVLPLVGMGSLGLFSLPFTR